MPLIINLIAFAVSAFALILAVVVNRRLIKRNKELKEKIDRYIKADNCTTPSYFVNKTTDGRIGVERSCLIDGYIHSTVIKLFTDHDQDYNRREAEELVKKLNEK